MPKSEDAVWSYRSLHSLIPHTGYQVQHRATKLNLKKEKKK